MTYFSQLESISPHRIWDGVSARVVEGERLTFSVIELAPSITVPAHQHENEQIGMVVQGAMSFTIGEETQEVGPGSAWAIPGNVPHTVTTGPEGVVVLEAFAPPRADWERLERGDPTQPAWPPA
ncbi:MAG TPA: cupin domain-containing protein [Thermoleophilaceae bacterium]